MSKLLSVILLFALIIVGIKTFILATIVGGAIVGCLLFKNRFVVYPVIIILGVILGGMHFIGLSILCAIALVFFAISNVLKLF